ncbi:MAG: hypothetical protein RL120_01945, partial [Gammaproteobacteria bacterium]
MNMKRLLVILLFPWWVAMAPAQGAETDVLFRASDGKLILPSLRIGEEISSVELILVDLDNLLFQVSLSSIAVITPADPGSVADQSAILGTWSDTGYSFTLNSDGSYVYVTTSSDTGCPLGTEQGTFQWEPATGVFLTVPGVDENGTCGFSHTSGIQRLSVDGNLLHYATSSHSSDLASGFDGPDGDDHGDATHSLSVTKSGNGSGNVSSSQQPGINCGSNCSFSFDDDTTVTLTATPDSGSYLFGWGNCTSVGGNGGTICNVTVGSDKTVEAIFVSTLLTVSTAG